MGNNVVKNPSVDLYDNVRQLSSISSYYPEMQNKPGYNTDRENILNKIKQNLDDGANVHYYGITHFNSYDTFQLAYVLDQDEAVDLMIPYIKHQPAYYNIPCYPILTHMYMYKKCAMNNFKNEKSPDLYYKYLTIATDAEKQDLSDYKNKIGKYENENPKKFFTKLCGDSDKECKNNIQQYLNTRKVVPSEFV